MSPDPGRVRRRNNKTHTCALLTGSGGGTGPEEQPYCSPGEFPGSRGRRGREQGKRWGRGKRARQGRKIPQIPVFTYRRDRW